MRGMIVSPMFSALPKTGEVACYCKFERKPPLIGCRFHCYLQVGERVVRLPQLVVSAGKPKGVYTQVFFRSNPYGRSEWCISLIYKI